MVEAGRIVNIEALRSDIGAVADAPGGVDLERYRTAFNAAADAIMIVDLDSALQLDANPAACALFEYSLDELRTMTGRMLAAPGQDQVVAELSRQLREHGWAHHGHVRIRTKGGRELWADVRMQVSSVNRQYITIVRDVTERVEREHALARETRFKDEFLATLSHELRNPLAPALTALALLRARIDNPEAQRFCAIIDRQMHHLCRLVDDLLDISRITHGKVLLQMEPVTAAELVVNAVEACRPRIEERRQKLRVNLPEEPLDLHADSARMVQVLSNLLNNASKYTAPGGQLSLSVSRSGDRARFSVADDGTGIPAHMLDQIFEPFVQLAPDPARTDGGLGIGLTLVKRLVVMHGGDVEARSEGSGRGTEVAVRLPARPPRPSTVVERDVASGPRDSERAAGGPSLGAPQVRRVLVVDDNVDAAEMLAAALRIGGDQVVVAHDGPEALVRVDGDPPDVAFIDIGLPGMSGYEVARSLRGAHPTTNLRLIALSGFSQPADVARALAVGFDRYLVKPVDLASIAEAMGTPTQARQT